MRKQNIRKNFKTSSPITLILCGMILGGCAVGPKPIKKFISPSQALYEEANAYFKQKDYPRSIATYEKFIKDYPTHQLVTGANLALAWTYYITQDYPKALEYLTQARTQDKDLKAWIDNLSADCKIKIAGTKEASASPTLFNIPEFTREEKIKIEGAVSEGSLILINNQEAKIENGLFSYEVNLTEGENIITINITDKDGKIAAKEAKVILDRTRPTIKVTSTELDDSGYVQLSGQTEKGANIFAEGEALIADREGKFKGQIKLPSNKQVKLFAEDKAGNTAEEIFSDTDYPSQPTGLRIRSIYGQNADLEWNENKEEDIKGYNVYYTLPGTFSDLKKNTEVIKDIRYTVTGLQSGNTYTLYIRAVDKMGNESQTQSQTVTAVIP